jgi:hypothetical protein
MNGFRTKSAPHRLSPRHAGTDRIHTTMRDFLGHPRGLTFLFTTEMWSAFLITECAPCSSFTW